METDVNEDFFACNPNAVPKINVGAVMEESDRNRSDSPSLDTGTEVKFPFPLEDWMSCGKCNVYYLLQSEYNMGTCK